MYEMPEMAGLPGRAREKEPARVVEEQSAQLEGQSSWMGQWTKTKGRVAMERRQSI